MASNYPHEKPMLDPETFNAIEITIRKSINSMMQKLIERRDQLIQQLQEIRENFLYEEERRIEDLKYLDERIRKKEEENIELHSKTNERMIEEWKLQKEQKNHPNPIPLPHFGVHHFDELRNQIEKFGALRDPTLNPKAQTETEALKSIYDENLVIFIGKLTWHTFAKDCLATFIFPKGLRENSPALAYWQWDKDMQGNRSILSRNGKIFILKDSYIRFFSPELNYYYFDGKINDGEYATMDLKLRKDAQGGVSSSEFKVALSYKE